MCFMAASLMACSSPLFPDLREGRDKLFIVAPEDFMVKKMVMRYGDEKP
jgi:hypothetical protein